MYRIMELFSLQTTYKCITDVLPFLKEGFLSRFQDLIPKQIEKNSLEYNLEIDARRVILKMS